jgi:OOP family OmpA-OmpF porin
VNQRLSEKRAEAVKTRLLEKGVSAHRLESKGYGESRPIDSAETPQARSKNRRVEFKVED